MLTGDLCKLAFVSGIMSLMDVESTAEALKEEEELIEAVETFVETAAVSIWSEIVFETGSAWNKTVSVVETLFPVVREYQRDEALFWADLEKFLLFALFFAITFFLLAPRSTNPNKTRRRKWLFGSHHHRADSKETVHITSGSSSPQNEGSVDGSLPRPSNSPVSAATLCMGRILSEDETDEDRFEELWDTISKTTYCRLVLPPECKLVERPRHAPAPKKKDDDNNNSSSKRLELEKDEDHPVHRMHMYWRQFLHLIKSLLSYDYVSAGLTLLHMLKGCLRSRKNNRRDADEEEEDDDDGSKASTATTSTANTGTATGSTATRRTSHNSNHWQQQQATAASMNRSKFDENNTLPKIPLSDADEDVDEEKKDEPSHPRKRANPEASVYFDSSTEGDLGEADVVRIPSKRLPQQQKEQQQPQQRNQLEPTSQSQRSFTGVKRKDALENYRSVSLLPVSPKEPLDAAAAAPQFHSSNTWPLSSDEQAGQESARFFFESANSAKSIQRMNVEVPVPDRNGYILGDEFLPDTNYTPLLVFVNSRSGPQQGQLLITQLRRLLNPIQVWDLADGGPAKILESFCVFSRLRILVCGGDGTVSWIMGELEKMNLKRWPAIAILPLGTGNDMARIHGWGGGFNNESLIGMLQQVAESYVSMLDRWEITIERKKKRSKSVKSFINYLGVGADAQAALQVHMLRESRPKLFFSRLVNKAWYGIFGAEDIIKASSMNIRNEITLIADGIEIPLPPDSQGFIFLNIDSYAGGVPLWSHGSKPGIPNVPSLDFRWRPEANTNGTSAPRRSNSVDEMRSLSRLPAEAIGRVDSSTDLQTSELTAEEKWARVTACDKPSSCQDGLLDVVSIRGAFHLGQIKVGLSNAQRLCQCREATIIVKKKVAVQIDGEPWRQDVCTMRVTRKKDSAVMLHRSADDSGGVETEMAKLLDWAEERQLIDSTVHAALTKEFSRRIESKTRQRRVRSQDNLVSSLKRAIGSSGTTVNPNTYTGGIAF